MIFSVVALILAVLIIESCHLLLYVVYIYNFIHHHMVASNITFIIIVYICQKSFNFINAFAC